MGLTRVVTFLGIGNPKKAPHYEPSAYVLDGVESPETPMHDAATTLRYGVGACSLVALATGKVRAQWFGEADLYRGLMREVGALPEAFGLVDIADGASQAEQMENFQALLGCLSLAPLTLRGADGVERVEAEAPELIVLDITHGWRALPFFAAAVVTFARSQARRRGEELPVRILYGAWDREEPARTEVWDMTYLIEVGDWDAALDALMRYGRADDFKAMAEMAQRRAMRGLARGAKAPPLGKVGGVVGRFADSLVTGRLPELLMGQSRGLGLALAEAEAALRQEAPLLEGSLEELRRWAESLHAEEVVSAAGLRAGLRLVEILLGLERYAEAMGAMRELLVTAWTLQVVPPGEILQPGCGAKAFNDQRHQVDRALGAASQEKGAAGLARLYGQMGDARNDLLHLGMRAQMLKGKDLREKAGDYLDELREALATAPEYMAPAEEASGAFVNFSNHPSGGWPEAQRVAALALGCDRIEDVAFPAVAPAATLAEVEAQAAEVAEAIKARRPAAALVSGEPTLSAAVVRRLQAARVGCYVATTERVASESSAPDGSVEKVSRFVFVAWREWPRLG